MDPIENFETSSKRDSMIGSLLTKRGSFQCVHVAISQEIGGFVGRPSSTPALPCDLEDSGAL